jgi:hypothetical protein
MRWHRAIGWRPRHADWWVACLFMIGSALFALGSFPPYSQMVDPRAVGITFVLGSLFFTAAALTVFVQENRERPPGDAARAMAWRVRRRSWWAAGVQFVGTLFFNVNTVRAMDQTFTVEETNRLVWAPDFFGCIAFLVASHLAWVDACGRRWCVRTDDDEWWPAALNYVGSIFFMASAIGSLTLPTTGEALNITLVNSGTFLGALCFLVGSYVLLPPASAGAARPSPA